MLNFWKSRRHTMSARMLPFALLLAACGHEGPLRSSGPQFLKASIAGSVQAEFEGTGDFHVGDDPRAGIRIQTSIVSRGVGASEGQRLVIYRRGAGRPGEGRYQVESLDLSSPQASGITAVYTRQTAGVVEFYAAQSGELVITESSKDRIAGHFRFTGFRYCASELQGSPTQRGPCRVPPTPIEGAPTVEVTGSFVAGPFDPEVFAAS